MIEAYPLAWPPGWPRTPYHQRKAGRDQFRRSTGPWTIADARDELSREVRALGGKSVVISSNFALRRDGLLMASARKPDDESIALYFVRAGKPLAMACDRYHDAVGNLRSLALAIEAMRQLERHGGGTMVDRAFEGFAALPAPGTKPWWEILAVKPTASTAEINTAFRRLAAERHPDRNGGSGAMMAELNVARDAGLKAAGGPDV
ncbi:J domain-containing protein [Bosea eneae]|uniref:J domain-containing protein n=1 Tax=Bosea eneae TaxID=151454 RepID=A0ABW0J048_9HYPH